jgi:hypothetical protein
VTWTQSRHSLFQTFDCKRHAAMRNWIAGLVLICVQICAPLPAQGQGPNLPAVPRETTTKATETDAGRLKPGQFAWSPELAPSGPMTIVANLATQRAHIYRNGVQIGVTTISSGRPGYETPTGVFTILQKARIHRSRKYDDAPMPFMQRLTWGGIALHGGRVRARPASHGCVRLPMDFSEILFKETRTGKTTVILTEGSPYAETIAGQLLLLAGADFRWQPELSPTGPVMILVSLNDRHILVLRDGILVGRSRMEISGGVASDPRALEIVASSGEAQWFHAGPSSGEAGQPPDPGQKIQVRVPAEFLTDLRSVVTPGETMLIVENPIADGDAPLMTMVSG